MKKLLLAVGIVMSLFAAGRANAQMTGNELQDKCKEEAKDEQRVKSWFSAGVCAGYINGVVDAQAVWNSHGNVKEIYPRLGACVPSQVTNSQTIKVVEKFLDNHPERLHEGAVVLVMQALHDAFPCPVEPPEKR